MNKSTNKPTNKPINHPLRHASRLLGAVLLCAALTAQAQAQTQTSQAQPSQAQVSVSDAWVRATVPQQKVTGAFMQLTSANDARLVDVSSAIAGRAELHQMSMTDNVMRMRQIEALDLPADKAVALTPGGYHVMLFELKAPIKAGDKIPLLLTVEGRDKERKTIAIIAVARGINGAPAHQMP
jgi:copper(I)-binding protein